MTRKGYVREILTLLPSEFIEGTQRKHGTHSGYQLCKCDECTAAECVYQNEQRIKRRKNLAGYRKKANHPSYYMYLNGCRCEGCCQANTAYCAVMRNNRRLATGSGKKSPNPRRVGMRCQTCNTLLRNHPLVACWRLK